jgi:hypothetical protein
VKNKRTLWIVLAAVGLLAVIAVVVILTRPQGSSTARAIVAPSASVSAPAIATPTPTPTPTPTTTAVPIPADALLVITGTANDVSGAKLAISIVVHQPVSKDDPAVAADLAQLTTQCSSDPNWTYSVIPESGIMLTDITATPIGATPWPATSEVIMYPGNQGELEVVGGAGLSPSVHYKSPALSVCESLPAIFGPAQATVAGMLDPRWAHQPPVPSPNYYRWEANSYGFASFGSDGNANPSVSISDCSVVVTDAAKAFGFDPAAWSASTTQDHVTCWGGRPE